MLDRSVLRWGGLAGMVGAVVGAVSNLLHPRSEDLGSAQGVVDLVTGSGIWVLDHYLIAWSIALGGVGLIALAHSLVQEPARSWGTLAVYFTVGSVVVGYLFAAVDGGVLKDAAEEGGPAGLAVAHVAGALFTALMGSLFGLVPVLIGIALLSGTQYPRWLGALSVGAGLIGLFTSSYTYLLGYEAIISNYVFTLGSLGVTIVLFTAGWYLWKGEFAGVGTPPIAGDRVI